MEIELTAENFDQVVLQAREPVLVDFWATWCGPCRMLAPVVAELAEEKAGELTVGKVNVDEAPELAARFGIISIPTLILFRNGESVKKTIGYCTKEELNKFIGE